MKNQRKSNFPSFALGIPPSLDEALKENEHEYDVLLSIVHDDNKLRASLIEYFHHKEAQIIEDYYTKNIEKNLVNPANNYVQDDILNLNERYRNAIKMIFISMASPLPNENLSLQELRKSFITNRPASLEEALSRVEIFFKSNNL